MAKTIKEIATLKRPLLAKEFDAIFEKGITVLIEGLEWGVQTLDKLKNQDNIPDPTTINHNVRKLAQNYVSDFSSQIEAPIKDITTQVSNLKSTNSDVLSLLAQVDSLISQAEEIINK